MNFAATFLFLLCSTLVAACSRLPQPAVSNGHQPSQSRISYFSPDPDDMSSNDFVLSKKIILTCEPTGIMQLPEGTCLGTSASKATMTSRGCVCNNEAYVAVPTKEGHTCVHLISVLETLRVIVKAVSEKGITENNVPDSGHLSDAQLALQLVEASREIDVYIRNGSPQSKLDSDFRFISFVFSFKGSVARYESECIMPPGPMKRKDILAEYTPI